MAGCPSPSFWSLLQQASENTHQLYTVSSVFRGSSNGCFQGRIECLQKAIIRVNNVLGGIGSISGVPKTYTIHD